MNAYAPPPGPPTPHVPEGWKAIWNDQYKEWFYVNIYTKISQWDKPTFPVYDEASIAPPGGPPGYSTGPNDPIVSGDRKHLDSNNPYASGGASTESDAALAARWQREEDARASSTPVSTGGPGERGASGGYYQQQHTSADGYPPNPSGAGGQYDNHQMPAREEKSRGFLGKLLSKGKMSGGGHGGGGHQQGHQQGHHQVHQQGHHPGHYQGHHQQGYHPHGYGGGYGGYQQGYMQQQQGRSGLGAGGGAALGLGGGLLGGMLIGEAMGGGGDDGGGYGGGDGGGGGGGDF